MDKKEPKFKYIQQPNLQDIKKKHHIVISETFLKRTLVAGLFVLVLVGTVTYLLSMSYTDSAVHTAVKKEIDSAVTDRPTFITDESLKKQDELLISYAETVKDIKSQLDIISSTENTEANKQTLEECYAKLESNIETLRVNCEEGQNLYEQDSPKPVPAEKVNDQSNNNTVEIYKQKWYLFNSFFELYADSLSYAVSDFRKGLFDEATQFSDTATKNLSNVRVAADFYQENTEPLKQLINSITDYTAKPSQEKEQSQTKQPSAEQSIKQKSYESAPKQEQLKY